MATIKGLTIAINGETTGLSKALSGVNSQTRDLQTELREMDRLLKIDPSNTELLTQKQKALTESIAATKEKLDILKDSASQAQEQLAKGEISQEQFRALEREVIKTEQSLKKLEDQAKEFGSVLSQKLEVAGEKMQELGDKVSDVGKKISMQVTAPIVGAGAAAFKMAADLEDAMGATDQIFKESAEEVKKWAEELESYYGISKSEAVEYSNMMGTMLVNIGGLTEDEAAKQAATLIELAGDLTAMYGGSTQDAVRALTGALKGNNTMLDNYGMAANDALIKAKALEMGLYSGTGQMDLATKQAATLALIMEQSGAAQGQASREAEGASGSMRAFTTEIKDLSASFGEILLPVITPLIGKLAEIFDRFAKLSPEAKTLIVTILGIAAVVGPLLIVIGKVISAVGGIITVISKLGPVVQMLTTGVGVLGKALAFLAANPIGIVIIAITAFIAAIMYLWNTNEDFRDGVISIYERIKEVIGSVVDSVKKFFTETIPKAITDTLNILTGLPDKMREVGANLLTGLWNGIQDKVAWLKRQVSGIVDKIKSWFTGSDGFDTHSPSKWGERLGENVSAGIAQGIAASISAVGSAVKNTVNDSATTVRNQPLSAATPAASQGQPIEIFLNLDGRQIAQVIIDPLTNELSRRGIQWV